MAPAKGAPKKRARNAFQRAHRAVNAFLETKRKNLFSGEMLTFQHYQHHPVYRTSYKAFKKHYRENETFQNLCQQLTRNAIHSRLKLLSEETPLIPDQEMIETGVEYIFRELPYLGFCDQLFNVSHPVFISYYQPWPVASYLYENRENLNLSQKVFLAIKDCDNP